MRPLPRFDRDHQRPAWRCVLLLCLALLAVALDTPAAIVSDVTNTRHNLSTSGPGTTKATGESQICIFCHTPHGATENLSPLWNREASTATYQGYDSSSIDATDLTNTVTNSSKLCLSCHDGTIAIGNVNVANGQENVSLTMTGTDPDGTMPGGSSGAQSGFTRDLGTDLRNDHPISFTYDSALALADGELRDPATSAHIGNRAPGIKPVVPLENNRLECVSCHDPHVRDDSGANIKFLRLNRLQQQTPAGGNFDQNNDIICLACHDKEGTAWSESAHAKPSVANEIYKSAAAAQREFPADTQVWQAACLNCHDTHTVQGARRLAREGTDSTATPKSGGNSAIEETCYQCHTTSTDSVLISAPEVPDIKTDFTTLARSMPITTVAQAASSEVHDIRDADFTEPQSQLGVGNLTNRHVECTDCHNPHRVMKNQLFNGTAASTEATHVHAEATMHTNLVSGVLRGSWGVEPTFSTSWLDKPTSYRVVKGDGGLNASTARSNTWVTREYQVCLKCHSDYGYDDNEIYPIGTRPDLGDFFGGTPSGTNGLTQYTNQAAEFSVRANDAGTGADQGQPGANHRSWHPVHYPTGRTKTIRSNNRASAMSDLFLAPWNGTNDVGNQTMYCSDCHGSGTNSDTVVPDTSGGAAGNWGPHGSNNNFILKGVWDQETRANTANALCTKCHNRIIYNSENDAGDNSTGFCCGSGDGNLHNFHVKRIGSALECTWCHVAVPHGWKNKALLVNLDCVGPEAGRPAGCTDVGNGPFTAAPYYLQAYLQIPTFRTSGNWGEGDCRGRDWMKDNCDAPN